MKRIKIGLIGYGYWGPNLARNITEIIETQLVSLAEKDPARRKLAALRYPGIKTFSDYESIIRDPEIDAVMIATPVFTHYKIAKAALEKGKHVWVEKPLASSSKEAERLVKLAKKQGCVLLVDHTFIYTPAVRRIREIVAGGQLGDIYYFDSVRINLGLFQSDVNVVWDLAPHDLSIMHYILGMTPKSVIATGAAHSRRLQENTAYISFEMPKNILAHLHVNWLSPVKIRRTILGGSKRMLVFDDLDPDEKIKIYDRGVDFSDNSKERLYRTLVKYRVGDMNSPYLDKKEALKVEALHFVDCIAHGKKPMTGGSEGLAVVRVLEAIDRSLKGGGVRVRI